MQKIIKFLTSKVFLAALALLLAGLAIWFIGPLLAFGTLKPLAAASMRITFIVLLLAFTLFFLAKWPVSIVGLAALSILIWHAGPLLMIGGMQPFGSETVRMLIIGILWLLYLAWGLYRLWQLMRKDPQTLDKVLNFGGKKPEQKLASEQIKELGGIVGQAMAQLKRMRTGATGLARLFEGKRYLYELPWYMIIGNPGAGKTTALINSGLKFPLAEQMGAAALRGQSGTANCTWWLTNQAVLIDTAGRYANHTDGGTGPEHNKAEWQGFLGLLRKQRPRAPINGALLAINVADLLGKTEDERIKLAADMRARLEELRESLGIRFPVYVVLTKMDLLAGFEAYFSTLTSDGRNQVWGFTLPYAKETTGLEKANLKTLCAEELRSLTLRLDAGVNARLQEEFDLIRRHQLALLPQEFEAITVPLARLVEDIFLDSRYDGTQLYTTLRGVYFTSAAQAPATLIADGGTLWQRLRRAFTGKRPETENAEANRAASTWSRSYFLHDLLTRLVFAESHLVRPNLRWEFRFKLLRTIGHGMAAVIFLWLFGGMWVSAGNNSDYLKSVHNKTQALTETLKTFYAHPDNAQVPDILSSADRLAAYRDLDPADPSSSWRFGLYTPPDVIAAGNAAYNALEDRMVLPFVVRRMETVLADAIRNKDERLVYDTLRVYLLMHDKTQFDAAAVKAWAVRDWETSGNAAAFGDKASMLGHVQNLFNGSRVVQSPFARNEGLIKQARDYLDGKPSLTRVYERLKANMQASAPDPFTLLQAVGPQAGTVFIRASGAPLDQGVPGIFTYAGYHDLFKKRLPELLQAAYDDDAWVMGRHSATSAQKKNVVDDLKKFDQDSRLATEIRRLYLKEYADQWEAFLGDVHALTGTTRAFNLDVMRNFAAPDSPLARLSRAVVRETTLTRPMDAANKGLLDKAQDKLDKQIQDAGAKLGLNDEALLERQLVDNRFAALREIVTGQADAGGASAPAGGGSKGGMDAINGLLNEYYTQLVVADNALTAHAIPAPDAAGPKLRMEAAKLPAPFRGILNDLVTGGTRSINNGIGEILVAQVNAGVGDFCRKATQGKYPFATSDQDVDADDFTRLFAPGGLMDDFFQKNLASYVDVTTKPWRYKQDAPDMPPIAGPSLDSFARAQQIRDAFFRDAASKKMSWKADIRVVELDPNITDLTLDVDGQAQRYAHGPVTPWNITWPGPRGGALAEINANPRIKFNTSTLRANGPWALFRLLDRGSVISTGTVGKLTVKYDFDGRPALLSVNAGSQANPLSSDIFKGFNCP